MFDYVFQFQFLFLLHTLNYYLSPSLCYYNAAGKLLGRAGGV